MKARNLAITLFVSAVLCASASLVGCAGKTQEGGTRSQQTVTTQSDKSQGTSGSGDASGANGGSSSGTTDSSVSDKAAPANGGSATAAPADDGTYDLSDFRNSVLFSVDGYPAPNDKVFSADAIGEWRLLGAYDADGTLWTAEQLPATTLTITERGGTYAPADDRHPISWEQDANLPQLASGDFGDDPANRVQMDVNDKDRLVVWQQMNGRTLLFARVA
ncbi:MAG: hypothetical protein J6D54_05210 [Olsenella sp.]|nr:hypothetical protein [Olsenella sp.]